MHVANIILNHQRKKSTTVRWLKILLFLEHFHMLGSRRELCLILESSYCCKPNKKPKARILGYRSYTIFYTRRQKIACPLSQSCFYLLPFFTKILKFLPNHDEKRFLLVCCAQGKPFSLKIKKKLLKKETHSHTKK
jgi:hypothetical protein